MPTHDYKCKECGNVFEVFRHFSELDRQVNCPNCGSEKNREMGREIGVWRGLCRGRGLNRGWAYQGPSYGRQHERRKNYERVMSIIN